MPSQRQEIIKHTKWFVLGYLAILFVYRYVIMIVSIFAFVKKVKVEGKYNRDM